MSAARNFTGRPVTEPASSSPPASAGPAAGITTIAIVERDPGIQKSLRTLVDTVSDFHCIAVHSGVSDALWAMPHPWPDVVLFDALLLPTPVTGLMARMKTVFPSTRILLLTTFDLGDQIFDLVREGASGDLPKTTPPVELERTVRWVCAGGSLMSLSVARRVRTLLERHRLSRQEEEIVAARAGGVPYPTIASQLGMEVPAVLMVLGGIYSKLEDYRWITQTGDHVGHHPPGRLPQHDRRGQ